MVPDIWSVTDRIFCHYGPFLPFYPPIGPENQNFEKIKKKNTWRYYDFTNVYHRWKAYDIWFFRRGVQQTKLFVIMDRFLLFCSPPLTTQKIKILKKWKRHLEILWFYISVPKIMIRWCMVREIWCVIDVIVISHFGLFFALLPL